MVDNFKSYFDGLVLGDASIYIVAGSSVLFSISQASRYIEWIYYIQDVFSKEGFTFCPICYDPPRKGMWGHGSYILKSHVDKFFTNQEKRWYSRDYNVEEYTPRLWHRDENDEWYVRKKTVPKDIKFTPECVANWYMGDGCVSINNGDYRHYRIQLSTQGFWKKDTDYLVYLLNDWVLEYPDARMVNSGITWINTQRSVKSFLNYIRNQIEIIKCFNYKIPVVR